MEIMREPNMAEGNEEQAKPSAGSTLSVDQAIRQAIIHCWMILPEAERSPEKVEKDVLRLVQRALEDMKEDAVAFGFSK